MESEKEKLYDDYFKNFENIIITTPLQRNDKEIFITEADAKDFYEKCQII